MTFGVGAFSEAPLSADRALATGTDVTADIAATQAADTAAAVAAVTVTASVAATQAADTPAIGSTVTDRASIDATQAADTADIVGAVATPVTAAIDVTQPGDSAELIVFTPLQNVGGGIPRQRRRKIVVDGRLYEVPERDIPALLEAVMLQRKPPSTAEVVEQAPAPRKSAPKAQKQPAKAREEEQWVQPTVDDAKARYDAMMAEINAQAQVDVARMMQRVAHRVIEDLIDEEEAAIALLMH